MTRRRWVSPQVSHALGSGTPVVALESALITHGFPPPANLDIARRMEATVREEGAVPATIAVLNGQARVGLSDEELEWLASDWASRKVSLRDLPLALTPGTSGGTTVAATLYLARRAGLRVLATGGIGGVHRGHPEDVSADLPVLAVTPMVVVCSGAKALLDLRSTLEHLETHGVPVVGYCTEEFPAFYSPSSGLRVDQRVDTPQEVAQIAEARAALGLSPAILVCVPVPEGSALPAHEAETAIAQALAGAETNGVTGKALTPFLLAQIVKLTEGRARRTNQALLVNNACVAARIAWALAASE